MRKRMSEAEWFASNNPSEMLRPCRRVIREHPRKGRLFAVACCHRIWHLLKDKRSRAAVKAAAQFADGLVGEHQLAVAEKAAGAAHAEAFEDKGKLGSSAEWAAQFAADPDAWFAARTASNWAWNAAGDGLYDGPEHAAQADLVRCIFGPLPFRSIAIDRSWLRWNEAAVLRLAEAIYHEPDFAGMAVLGDTLQKAGCTDSDILNHCRQPGHHVRGCWVLDLLLGKD